MKRKGKVFLAVLAAILVAIGLALYGVLSNLDSIVAGLIEDQGSQATGTAVTVGSVSIDIRNGSGTISGLEVANPPGFSDRPAIAFDEIRIGMEPLAATSAPIVIREVSVAGASVLMEQTTAGNNLRTLQSAMQQPAPDEGADDAGPAVVIERFVLRGATARVEVPQLDESREVAIGRIEVTDIGRATNGATAGAVAKQILEPIVRAALQSAATRGLGEQLREELDDAKDKLLDRLPARE